jgi:hypothetical protein
MRLTGLETWFRLPGGDVPTMKPPPRWKMWLVSIVAVYPLVLAFQPAGAQDGGAAARGGYDGSQVLFLGPRTASIWVHSTAWRRGTRGICPTGICSSWAPSRRPRDNPGWPEDLAHEARAPSLSGCSGDVYRRSDVSNLAFSAGPPRQGGSRLNCRGFSEADDEVGQLP